MIYDTIVTEGRYFRTIGFSHGDHQRLPFLTSLSGRACKGSKLASLFGQIVELLMICDANVHERSCLAFNVRCKSAK